MSDFTKIIRLGTVEAWRWHLNDLNDEDIPDDVTAWLQSLPATDRQPAWV